jgi:PKD repeat protein
MKAFYMATTSHTYLKALLKKWMVGAVGSLGLFASAQYCSSSATSTADTDITLVIFNTINNPTSGCATYNNYTALTTNITPGSTYTLQVRAGTCGGEYTKGVRTFIDYNGDFDFLDPGEAVAVMGPVSTTTTLSASVTVPMTAVPGPKRMRVVCVETSSPGGIASCGTYTWGETEDYSVNILSPSPTDVGASAVLSPVSGCGLDAAEVISVTVNNYGTSAASGFNMKYRINGGPTITEPFVGTMAPSATTTFNFATTADLSLPGVYNIKVWADWTLDGFHGNDTINASVTAIPGVSTFPYYEGFESGAGGWIDGGANETWIWGTPAKAAGTIVGAAAGTKCWVNGGLTGTYLNNDDSYVIGPCFDFSSLSNPWIRLSVYWETETNWDGAALQASTDFGVTWVTIGNAGDPTNWYNNGSIISTPGGFGQGWCGSTGSGSGGWLTAMHPLDGLAGAGSVRLRIAFSSDGSVVDDGFAFDEIYIADGPNPDLGPDVLLCAGDTIGLTPTLTYDQYYWNSGDTTAVNNVYLGKTGTMIVRVHDSIGFYGFDTVVVSISNPFLDLGPDTTVCPGFSVLLDAAWPGSSHIWSDGSTDSTLLITTPGTYWVTLTDSVGCQKTDSIVLTNFIPPVLDLGPDRTACINDTVVLDAGPGPSGTDYIWNTGAFTQIQIVTSPGLYWASVTTPGGCAAVDTVEVFSLPVPSISLGSDRTECGPYVLDAGNPGSTYFWSTGATTQTVTLSSPGTYSVTVTNSSGCEAADSINILIGSVPLVDLGPDLVICNSVPAVLDAGNPGLTHQWNTGATTQTISVTTPSVYIVEVIDPSGCVGTDTIVVELSGTAVALGPDHSVCENEGTLLDAGNPSASWVWSNGATTQTIFVTLGGTYSVSVTDAYGCVATDVITLTAAPAITADFTAPSTGTLFAPVTFTDVSGPGPVSWNWDFGDGATSTLANPSHAFAAFGIYTVTLIVTNGTCKDTTQKDININSYIGVDESTFASGVSVYPNPTSGTVRVEMDLLERMDVKLSIIDLAGRVLQQVGDEGVIRFETELDLSREADGIYLLEMDVSGRKAYRKIVLTR